MILRVSPGGGLLKKIKIQSGVGVMGHTFFSEATPIKQSKGLPRRHFAVNNPVTTAVSCWKSRPQMLINGQKE